MTTRAVKMDVYVNRGTLGSGRTSLKGFATKDLPRVFLNWKADVITKFWRGFIPRLPRLTGALMDSYRPYKGTPRPRQGKAGAPIPGDERLLPVLRGMTLKDKVGVASGSPYARKIEFTDHSKKSRAAQKTMASLQGARFRLRIKR